MGLPTDRTVTTIATEGLKQGGRKNPSPSQITRAEDEWLRNALRKLQNYRPSWTILESKASGIITAFDNKISLPTDFLNIKKVKIFYGSHEGSCQAASSNTITLEAGEDVTEDGAKYPVFITTGSDKGDKKRITGYNTTTLIATVDANWATTPSTTDGYMIADTGVELNNPPDTKDFDTVPIRVPREFIIYGEPAKIYLDSIVDDDQYYGYELEYGVNLNKVDLTDARMTAVYNAFEDILVQEICVATLRDIPNTKRLNTELHILKGLYKSAVGIDLKKNLKKGIAAFRYKSGMPRGR